MPTILRRLILWTIICCVSAAPSFYVAVGAGKFNKFAMIVGVCLFIAIYTATTSTAAFARFHRRVFVRRTLYIGYGLRMLATLTMPMGNVAPLFGIALFGDLFPGMLSVELVQKMGLKLESFGGTLTTTIVQGTLLNIIIFVIMLVIYFFQRLFMKRPAEQAPRGFEVILPTAPQPVRSVE